MNFAFLTDGFVWTPGGSHRAIYELANELSRRGHRADVLHMVSAGRFDESLSEIILSTVREQGGRAALTAVRRRLRNPVPSWIPLESGVSSRTLTALSAIPFEQYDVVIATTWRTAHWLAERCFGAAKSAYLIFHDETKSGHPVVGVRTSWALPMKKLFISEHSLEMARREGAAPPLFRIALGVEHSVYRLYRPLNGRAPAVACSLSTKASKGNSTALAALDMVAPFVEGLKVHFYGFKRRAAVPGYGRYISRPTDVDVAESILSRASVYLSASHIEGFGLAAAEAVACGCALVATDSGGIREYARHGETALLSEPGHVKGLAENLFRALTVPDLRLALAENGLRVIRRFTWQRCADEFLAALS